MKNFDFSSCATTGSTIVDIRSYVANKGFKIIFSFSPDHENVIDITPPGKWLQRGVFDGKLFKISHEQICIGKCHARAHRGAMGL